MADKRDYYEVLGVNKSVKKQKQNLKKQQKPMKS